MSEEEKRGLLHDEREEEGYPSAPFKGRGGRGGEGRRWRPSRLSCCLMLIGCACVVVTVTVMSVFLVFFEPCLSPFSTSFANTTRFTEARGPISVSVEAAGSVTFKPLPSGSESSRIDTAATLSATSEEELARVEVLLGLSQESYSLAFERPAVLPSLAHCNVEDAVLSVSPYFSTSLNVSLAAGPSGFIEVRSMLSTQFVSFRASAQEGPISIGIITCLDTLDLQAHAGPIKVAASNAARILASTGAGDISLSTPSAGYFDISSGSAGDVSVTSLTLTNLAEACSATITTRRGHIHVDLVDMITNAACRIQLTAAVGNIHVAIKGFSGTFLASTENGHINVPGFMDCDNASLCTGLQNPDGLRNHEILLATQDGDVELIFV